MQNTSKNVRLLMHISSDDTDDVFMINLNVSDVCDKCDEGCVLIT